MTSEKDPETDVEEQLDLADSHIQRADELLEEVADDLVAFVEDEFEVSKDVDTYAEAISIKLNNDSVLSRLNDQLPPAYYAELDGEYTITIGKIEIDDDLIEDMETVSSRKTQKGVKDIIRIVDQKYPNEPGAPLTAIREHALAAGLDPGTVENVLENLRTKGDVYSPSSDQYKVV